MQLLTRTLDIEDEAEELEGHLNELRAEENRLIDEALALDESEDAEDQERFAAVEEQVEQLDAMITITEGYLEVLTRASEEWDGSEIVIRELTGAETRSIATQARKRAEKAGVENYDENFHETLMLQNAVESTPPGCPDPEKIGDLPDRLFDWLVNRANTLNTVGEFSVGNSSLREKMAKRRREN